MGENEEATLRSLSAFRQIIDGLIEQHRGRFVGSAGDSVIAEFASVVNAVQPEKLSSAPEVGLVGGGTDAVSRAWAKDFFGRR
jgi:class 3 adenylate cyclase